MVVDAALRLRSDRLRRSTSVLMQRQSNPDAPV
jgi:hypothetical protein